MKVRVINTGFHDAYYNMALDQALSESVAESGVPVLKMYGWSPAAVSVGYFQKFEEEVDLEKCKEFGVDTVRRITGGGAVFHDKEITYSFIIPLGSDFIRQPTLDSYEDICQGIIKAGEFLNLDVKFVPLNYLVIGQQKVSINAQTRRNGVLIQHGTIILDLNIDKMIEILLVPNEKIKDKMIERIKERVTSISLQLGREVLFDEMADVLKVGFVKAFPLLKFENSEVTPNEEMKAVKYAKEKYSDDSWRFKF
jgi:lipoate-protein ligase A